MLTLASFRRATQRDFGNSAFRDEIEKVIESRDELLAACKAAVERYEWIISDHPKLDPDGELTPELTVLHAAIAKAEAN